MKRGTSSSRAALLACAAALALLGGCRGGRIPSESASGAFSTRRAEVEAALGDAERRHDDIRTYAAKNARAQVDMGGRNVGLRANLSFARSAATTVSGRLVFPPISVGRAELDGEELRVRSRQLDVDKTVKMPGYANEILQCALLGQAPPLYRLFGEADYSRFALMLTADDKYALRRSEGGMEVVMFVNAADFTLSGVNMTAEGSEITLSVGKYALFGGHHLPSLFRAAVAQPRGVRASMELALTDIEINQE